MRMVVAFRPLSILLPSPPFLAASLSLFCAGRGGGSRDEEGGLKGGGVMVVSSICWFPGSFRLCLCNSAKQNSGNTIWIFGPSRNGEKWPTKGKDGQKLGQEWGFQVLPLSFFPVPWCGDNSFFGHSSPFGAGDSKWVSTKSTGSQSLSSLSSPDSLKPCTDHLHGSMQLQNTRRRSSVSAAAAWSSSASRTFFKGHHPEYIPKSTNERSTAI